MIKINDLLVNAIKVHTPQGVNIADQITDTILLSKEAIYRRLRGEIPFTLEEATLICNKMGISMDNLIEQEDYNSYSFHVASVLSSDSFGDYYKLWNNATQIRKKLENNPDSFILLACNICPHIFSNKYDMISKMIFFKRVYNINAVDNSRKMANLIIPDNVKQVQKEYMYTSQNVRSSIIMSLSVFHNLVQDILFFYNLDILTPEEISILRKELLDLMDDIEQVAMKGTFESGCPVDIYLSHTFFDATYVYLEYGKKKFCSIHYGLNHLDCDKEQVCNNQRLWIQSLMRYSSLISKSGELLRSNFFKEQREFIKTLEKISQ